MCAGPRGLRQQSNCALSVSGPRMLQLLSSASKPQELHNRDRCCNDQNAGHECKLAAFDRLIEQAMADDEDRSDIIPSLYSFPSRASKSSDGQIVRDGE